MAADGQAGARRLALVVWSGQIGGAETMMLALARRFRSQGVQAEFVIVGDLGPLAQRITAAGMRCHSLGFARGRQVLRHPRRYAQAVTRAGPDGALLMDIGFLGAALRLGGYREPIVAVENGTILFPAARRHRRMLDWVNRLSGAWADDAEVGVSKYVLGRMSRQPHARRLALIHNAIDPDVFVPCTERSPSRAEEVVVGFVGRLVPGKGVDILVPALAAARRRTSVKLMVAGDGPERPRLEELARRIGISDSVSFLGEVHDVRDFWCGCDIAVVPSDAWIESFCMSALEAMACGRPVIATRNGGLPEVVLDGITGQLVPPRDVAALAEAILSYARAPARRREHGAAARRRAIDQFNVEDCVRAYLQVLGGIQPVKRLSTAASGP